MWVKITLVPSTLQGNKTRKDDKIKICGHTTYDYNSHIYIIPSGIYHTHHQGKILK